MKYSYTYITWLLVLVLPLLGAAQVKSVSLRQAFQQAGQGNRTIRVQDMEAQKASMFVQESRSYLKPSLSGGGSYTLFTERPVIFLRDPAVKGSVQDVMVGGRHAFDFYLKGTYPLLHPQLQQQTVLAGIQEKAEQVKTKDLKAELAAQVARIYYTVLFHDEQLHLLGQSLLRNEQALLDAKALFDQGKNLKTDTLRHFIAVQSVRGAMEGLGISRTAHLLDLKQLLGFTPDDNITLSDHLTTPQAEWLHNLQDSLTGIAIRNRPDIQLGELQKEYAQNVIKAVDAEFKPQLWAVGQYQLQGQSDRLNIWNYHLPRTSFLGVQLSVPLFAGNRQKYKASSARLAVEQENTRLEELKSKTDSRLRVLRDQWTDAYRRLSTENKKVQAADMHYSMIRERYHHGLSSRLELTDAELALTDAKLNQVEIIYTIRLLEVQLQKESGLLTLD